MREGRGLARAPRFLLDCFGGAHPPQASGAPLPLNGGFFTFFPDLAHFRQSESNGSPGRER